VRWLRLIACVLLVGPATMPAVAQAPDVRTARLTPAPVEAATFEQLGGASGTATATLAGDTLVVTGEFAGLRAPATSATLHAAERGLRGPVLATLGLTGTTAGTLAGEVTLTDVQAGYFRDQRLYVQLQNDDYPDGLLRGWLVVPEDPQP
jgi:hypothetical protein